MSGPTTEVPRHGGCLCGAVRFAVTGPLRPIVACHCGQCRKVTGNYVAATSTPRDSVAITGEVRWYRSSDAARRGFCPVCGSALFWDGPGANLSIMAGALDADDGLVLAGHIFCADKGGWYELPGDVRQVPGAEPELTTVAP